MESECFVFLRIDYSIRFIAIKATANEMNRQQTSLSLSIQLKFNGKMSFQLYSLQTKMCIFIVICQHFCMINRFIFIAEVFYRIFFVLLFIRHPFVCLSLSEYVAIKVYEKKSTQLNSMRLFKHCHLSVFYIICACFRSS